MNALICGDTLAELGEMPAAFANMGVTSPPDKLRKMDDVLPG